MKMAFAGIGRRCGVIVGFAVAILAVGEPVKGQPAMAPMPIPAQVSAKTGTAQLPDTRLYYWDTGGDGPAIVLLHPATGSAMIWGYQQPAFAKAGYRVIGYSRRGYYNSAPYEPAKPGTGADDLRALADQLGLQRFHAVASAAGRKLSKNLERTSE